MVPLCPLYRGSTVCSKCMSQQLGSEVERKANKSTIYTQYSSFFFCTFSSQRKSDYFKLIFAALILVILRMWDAIYVSLSYHRNYDQDVEDSQWIVLLIFLAVRVHLITMQPKLLYRF